MKKNKIKELEAHISKKRGISKNSKKLLIWLIGHTKGFTESVSVNVPWWYDPDQEELDRALRALRQDEEFSKLFLSAAPEYLLSVGVFYTPGEGHVMAVSLYKSIKDMRFVDLPQLREIRSIPIR